MQMYPPNLLRQIHEDRIAPYIKGKPEAQPYEPELKQEDDKESEQKANDGTFNLLKQLKRATQS